MQFLFGSVMKLQDFRRCLGEPAYEDSNVLLYSGDCLTLMDKFPDNCIPLTVTSPPYNIGREYEEIR